MEAAGQAHTEITTFPLSSTREWGSKGKEPPSPWNPILWWEDRGKVVPSGRGLACGLQDQRLMARPPARAGGRGGSLTGGKSRKKNGFSPPFPKGYLSTSPARPAGGRAATGLSLGGPQARYPVRGTASPTQLHQRRESRGKNLFPLGFFPPFLPKKWGPGRVGQGSLPFQRRGSWNNLLPQQKKHLLAKK